MAHGFEMQTWRILVLLLRLYQIGGGLAMATASHDFMAV